MDSSKPWGPPAVLEHRFSALKSPSGATIQAYYRMVLDPDSREVPRTAGSTDPKVIS